MSDKKQTANMVSRLTELFRAIGYSMWCRFEGGFAQRPLISQKSPGKERYGVNLVFTLALFIANATSFAQTPGLPNFAAAPDALAAQRATGGPGSSNDPAVEAIKLLGDPAKPGPYVILLRVGPRVRIQAHTHSGDRVCTVLKGTFRFGYGSRFDASQLRSLPAGSIYTEPSQSPHFAESGDESVVVQITGFGPTDTHYVDPADDPTRKP